VFLRVSCLLYSLQVYPERLPIHSLPTRRSSDLAAYTDIDVHDLLAFRRHATSQRDWGVIREIAENLESSPELFTRIVQALRELRSEEHTSELQSRENLVCRRLLENKKQANT